MSEHTIITMRRPDGKLQPLHGPRAAQVAARRVAEDDWSYVDPPATADPEPAEAEQPIATPPARRSFRLPRVTLGEEISEPVEPNGEPA